MAANNAIKMAYNFTTVAQTVVFNQAMNSGGTLTLTADVKDGGGRAPGDPFTLKMVFYNSSNQVITTVQQANTLIYGATDTTNYSLSTSNCGGSCSNVAYVIIQFYGKDGGYWAGNYGPYITNPSLTFAGGGNLLYNPEFGTYTGSGTTYAQGWTSSAGWQNCALYSGSATCVVDLGGTVNASGGGYSSTGGTTSGTSGGYVSAPTQPTLCCGGSSATFNADSTNVTMVNQFNQRITADSKVLVEQIGNFNTTTIQQTGTKNNYVHVYTDGSTNTTNVTQSGNASTQANYVDLSIQGNNNITNITQTSTGGAKGAFVSETDNGNNIKIQQKDAGNHYAAVTVSGGNKTVDITQQGSATHMASVTLSGNPTNLNLTQSGTTQQYYSITHNCATAGGCAAITVTQGQ
jgi:hypothetical protein